MNESIKYTFVCDPDNCDTLIEVTCTSGFDFPNGEVKLTCPCGRQMAYISATIQPNNEREKMEDIQQEITRLLDQVNAITIQRDNLELQVERLQNANTTYSKDASLQYGRINRVKEYLADNYDMLEGYADAIAEILDIELSRDITYSVQMTATVTVSVPVGQDGEDILRENLYIDANHGDVIIDDYEVCNVSEEY